MKPDSLVILAGVTAALHIGKLPPAIPRLQEAIGLTLVQSGFMLSLVQLAGMLLGITLGTLSQTLGLRRTLIAGLLMLAATSMVGGFAEQPELMLLLRAIEGLGFLCVVLPAPGLLRNWVAPERLGRRLGLWGCYMGIGTSLALLVGPSVMDAGGWPGWWWLLAGVAAAMALVVLAGVPGDSPDTNGKRAIPPAAGRMRETFGRLVDTLRWRGPWLVAIMFALYTAQWLAVIGFLPVIYAQAGITGNLSAVLTALAAAINISGNLSSGYLLHRGLLPAKILIAGYSAMLAGALVAFHPLVAALPWLQYLAILVFSAVGGLIPGTLYFLGVRVSADANAVSTTVGWLAQWSAIGQFLGPPIVAAVASAVGGWGLTGWLTATLSLTGIVLALQVRRF